MNSASIIEILLVEDNPGDIKLIKVALEEFKILYKLRVVRDGFEALDYLLKENMSLLQLLT